MAEYKGKHLNGTQFQICSHLDRLGKPTPASWTFRQNGKIVHERTWCGALKNPVLKGRVKTYLAKIKPNPPLEERF